MHLLFYLILYPLSLFPLTVLYGIGYIFYLCIYYLIGYRKNVTTKNLMKSFPDLDKKEIKSLRKSYYKHLSQIAAEMLKMLTMTRKHVLRRYVCENPELVNQYYEQGKSVILVSSHYNNWEWMILSLPMQYHHRAVGVGKANTNKSFEKLVNRARTRYGTQVVFADHVREIFQQFEQNNTPVAYMMLSDQSPNNVNKSYKTTFLNQPSAIIYGPEYFAKKYDIPVIYYEIIKERKGHYRIVNHLITDRPTETDHGEITEKYVRHLETTIRRAPAFWLWSHRRWKHKVELPQEN